MTPKIKRQTFFEDNHIHSTYSDGQHSLGELLEYNHFHDQLDLTMTDHVNKETDWFFQYIEEIKRYRKQYPHFAIRIGCEVKILEDGTLNTRKDILDAAEVIVGSVHHFSNIKSLGKEELLEKEYTLTKVLARHPDIDVLGHPFSMGQRFHKHTPPIEYVETVYRLCVENGIRFELSPKFASEPIRELAAREIAKGNRNNFSFGSDVHKSCGEIGDAAHAFAEPITVFVTGGGAGVGQSILKSLKLSKVRTRVIVGDSSPLAVGLYRAQASHIIPRADNPTYLTALEKICRAEQVDLLLIGTDVELNVFAQNKAAFEKATGACVIVSDPETVAISDDKWETVGFLKSHGFPHVRSALVDSADAFIRDVEFPIVVKPRIGARSVGFRVVPNEVVLRSALQKDATLILQEYLQKEDEEYTCGAFFYEGSCYGVAVMKRWLRNGDTYKAIALRDPEMERFVEAVGKKLRIVGPCNFQLRKSGDDFKIFEINCRFSGTTGAASALGFNVVNALLQKLFFNRPLRPLAVRESYIFRYWNEVFAAPEEVETLTERGRLEEAHSDTNLF